MATFGRNDFEKREPHAGSQAFAPIPNGKYRAIVSGGSISQHPDGDDQWELEFTIQSEPYMGRRVWNKYRLESKDAEKRQWDKNSLGQVYDSIGLSHEIQHPSQMVSQTPVEVAVRQFTSKSDSSKVYNFVKYCNPLASAAHTKAVQTATTTMPGVVVEHSTPVNSAPSTQEIPW